MYLCPWAIATCVILIVTSYCALQLLGTVVITSRVIVVSLIVVTNINLLTFTHLFLADFARNSRFHSTRVNVLPESNKPTNQRRDRLKDASTDSRNEHFQGKPN